MKTKLFDYHLPPRLIAQKLAVPRDRSRLLILDRSRQHLQHDYFHHLAHYLRRGDVLVFNDSKVFPARLFALKPTGGRVEVFLLRPVGPRTWQCLVGGKRLRPGARLSLLDRHGKKRSETVELVQASADGIWEIRFTVSDARQKRLISLCGQVPTPPYIKSPVKFQDYQNIYANAQRVGSAAAPTAGLHFTRRLLRELKQKGVEMVFVTLHVGLGTFQPVKVDQVEDHQVHAEYAEVSSSAVKQLVIARREGRRIIAVGTTSARVLESLPPLDRQSPRNFSAWITTFIYPGHTFKNLDGLITNFHLPQSSLLMLVSALAGRQRTLRAYEVAKKRQYRFYSLGDGMLIV